MELAAGTWAALLGRRTATTQRAGARRTAALPSTPVDGGQPERLGLLERAAVGARSWARLTPRQVGRALRKKHRPRRPPSADLDRRDVGVRGHVVAGQVVVDDVAEHRRAVRPSGGTVARPSSSVRNAPRASVIAKPHDPVPSEPPASWAWPKSAHPGPGPGSRPNSLMAVLPPRPRPPRRSTRGLRTGTGSRSSAPGSPARPARFPRRRHRR
ncbi:MAG: hypothetical protein V7646_1130 [Pseudonocardia sp.]